MKEREKAEEELRQKELVLKQKEVRAARRGRGAAAMAAGGSFFQISSCVLSTE